MDADKIIEAIEQGGETAEDIAESLTRIADAADTLRDSGLSIRALHLLLKDISGVPLYQIERVLGALPRLREFVVPPEAPDA